MLLVFILFALVQRSDCSILIKVDPTTGNDSLDCFDGKEACKTIEYVFYNGTNHINNSVILLMDGLHYVNRELRLDYHWNVTLKGLHAVIQCSSENAGFTIVYSDLFTIENLTVRNCGVEHASTTVISNGTAILLKHPTVRIAFDFIFSSRIAIKQCNFVNNTGVGVALYNINKSLQILNSTFISNSNANKGSDDRFLSGGGVNIEYTSSCNALPSFSCAGRSSYNQNTTLSILDCVFENNIADNRYGYDISDFPIDKTYVTFGKGGGLSVNVFGDAKHNVFYVKRCMFKNNSAMWGGGMSVTFKDSSEKNYFNIQDSWFRSNKAVYSGAGLRIQSLYIDDFVQSRSKITSGNTHNIFRSHFENNSAILGGGVAISATTRIFYVYDTSSRDTLIKNCTFQHNTATVGYAAGLNTINLNEDIIGPGMSYQVVMEDSIFYKNKMVLTEDKKVIGHGAIYSDMVTLKFEGVNKFTENDNSAIVLDSSSLLFARLSKTTFNRNTGFTGGAISLSGLSWLTLGFSCTVLFRNNTVTSKGGAVYVKDSSPPRLAFRTSALSSHHCFFRYELPFIRPDYWTADVIFDGNKAPVGSGNSIYASTLQNCRNSDESRVFSQAFKWKPFKYLNNSNGQAEIATNAIRLQLINTEWDSYPFLPFSPHITLLDEKNQSVYGSVRLKLNSYSSPVRLDPPNNIFLLRNKINRLRIIGKKETTYNFKFISSSGQHFKTPSYNGTLKVCPPGFRPDFDNDKCLCMDNENGPVVHCNEDGSVFLVIGKWGYIDKHGILQTLNCPKHVCKCKNKMSNYFCQLDIHDQCIDHRSGILCGSCKKGLSVYLGNEECGKCNNINVIIIGIVLVIVLPVFVLALLYFNVDAFSGYLNGFFYFYQMISLLISENLELYQPLSFLIGVITLSGTGNATGICLYDGLDNLSKLGMNYVTPTLLILITFGLGVWAPERIWRKMFSRNTSVNDVYQVRTCSFGRAFSIVSVICYSSLTETTFKALHVVVIHNNWILFNASPTVFFSNSHLKLAIPALFVCLFVVIGFPLLLIFQSYFTNRFEIFRKIDLIVETLKSCFKVKYRMFSAYYFVCRFILRLIDYVIQDEEIRLIVLCCFCVLFLIIFAFFQPYEMWTYNFFDILLLTDLTIVSLMNMIISIPFAIDSRSREKVADLCLFFIWLPIVIVLFRLAWYLFLRLQERRRKNTNTQADHQDTPDSCFQQVFDSMRNRKKGPVRQTSGFPVRVLDNPV